jgi:hypothetical protein
MGVRLYNTLTGRFLQVDPVPGGSAGPYLYPTNPVTTHDLDGESWVRKAGRWVRKAARSAGQWAWNNRGTIASGLALAACFSPGILLCAGASAAAVYVNYRQRQNTSNRMRGREIAFNVVTIGWARRSAIWADSEASLAHRAPVDTRSKQRRTPGEEPSTTSASRAGVGVVEGGDLSTIQGEPGHFNCGARDGRLADSTDRG